MPHDRLFNELGRLCGKNIVGYFKQRSVRFTGRVERKDEVGREAKGDVTRDINVK
jgi:hypothetical protein